MIVLEWIRKIWAIWLRFGQLIGDIVGRVVLTILYFTLVLPFGVGVRVLSDPLKLKESKAASFWLQRPEAAASFEEARRQ